MGDTAPAQPAYEKSRVWTIPVPPHIAERIGVTLLTVTATQMGEIIAIAIDMTGACGAMVYACDGAIDLAEAKAVCDRFTPALWPQVMEWRARHARLPWTYIGAHKPRSALRDRYVRGTDPGVLMRPEPGDAVPMDQVQPMSFADFLAKNASVSEPEG